MVSSCVKPPRVVLVTQAGTSALRHNDKIMKSRPATPKPVKRTLRQRAGFGCCVCGKPVYQYHHVIPWSVEEHFRPDDMMLLCPEHHDQATKGALTEARQRAWQASPFNRRQGFVSGALMINQTYSAIRTGGVLLVGDGSILQIDEVPVLRVGVGDDGEMLLSLLLADETGTILACIEENEWVSGDPSVFDIQSDHQVLTIHSEPRKIALKLRAKGAPLDLRADLWWNGYPIRLTSGGLFFGEQAKDTGFMDMGLVGFEFKVDTAAQSLTMAPYAGEGYMVSEPDLFTRLHRSVEKWKEVVGT